MTHGFSTGPATAGALPRGAATTADTSRLVTGLWSGILTMAAVGSSLALTCVAPFAAFAVATAGTGVMTDVYSGGGIFLTPRPPCSLRDR
jgi:hypothetical protein